LYFTPKTLQFLENIKILFKKVFSLEDLLKGKINDVEKVKDSEIK
jgi:hypothetical protein